MSDDFEPFYDYERLSDETVSRLAELVNDHRKAADDLVAAADKESAGRLLSLNKELVALQEDAMDETFVVPVMVHVAGAKKTEEHPDNTEIEITVQRCARCASPVQIWHEGMMGMGEDGPEMLQEEDVPWWDEGDIIAKATGPGGIGMYEVEPGRELEEHERECVGIPNL